jgi:hypothetical protein
MYVVEDKCEAMNAFCWAFWTQGREAPALWLTQKLSQPPQLAVVLLNM